MSKIDFANLETCILAFKKVLEIWDSEAKTQGFMYTDDPKYTEIFKNCKAEHDKFIEMVVEIREKLKKTEHTSEIQEILTKSQELYMLCDGFRSMIDEVEVEESAIVYIHQIEKVYKEILDLFDGK